MNLFQTIFFVLNELAFDSLTAITWSKTVKRRLIFPNIFIEIFFFEIWSEAAGFVM